MKIKMKHLRIALALMFIGQLVGAWVLKLLIHWLVVGGECITFGHTLGAIVILTTLRIIFALVFDKDNEKYFSEWENEQCK